MQPTRWFDALYQCQQQGKSFVLVTVLGTAGSTPRETGSKMVITDDSQFDTIGGGHLEFEATRQAREYLLAGKDQQHIASFPLSSKLGQCCGGAVKILYEVYASHCQHIAVFGGGHVARALVPILAQLPLQIHWIDSREHFFDDVACSTNVTCIIDDDPVAEMADLPANSWVVILTHNHQLDYDLVEQALHIPGMGYVGMIGSETKAKRFRTRLSSRGFSSAQIHRLISPIGDLSVPGKRPIEVAISISAQLIQHLNAPQNSTNTSTQQASKEAL